MRFIADESCDFAVVRALREAGHDVVAVAELNPGAEDDLVITRQRLKGTLEVPAFWHPSRGREPRL